MLYERLRKYHTTATPFGYFIIQEATTLNRKIQIVNRDLQVKEGEKLMININIILFHVIRPFSHS